MIGLLLHPLRARLHAAQNAARNLMLRGLLAFAGVLMALLGTGFLLLALFVALRHAVGTVPAALIMTAVLFVTSAALFVAASRQGPPAPPLPVTPSPEAAVPSDPATVAAFTVAFVLGRYLADRKRR